MGRVAATAARWAGAVMLLPPDTALARAPVVGIGLFSGALNTMRFNAGVLVASDRHLARYFKYVGDFPRAEPCA